jgi:hypothetical protein
MVLSQPPSRDTVPLICDFVSADLVSFGLIVKNNTGSQQPMNSIQCPIIKTSSAILIRDVPDILPEIRIVQISGIGTDTGTLVCAVPDTVVR